MQKPSLLFALVLALLAPAQAQMTPQQLVQDAMQKQQAGDLQGAVPEYRAFLKLYPEVAAIHSNLGAALATQGRVDEAGEAYRKALELKPDAFEAVMNLGIVLSDQGNFDEATAWRLGPKPTPPKPGEKRSAAAGMAGMFGMMNNARMGVGVLTLMTGVPAVAMSAASLGCGNAASGLCAAPMV